jgi:uncharacterized protein (DUF2141 family)
MKSLALLLVGGVIITAAQAQSGATEVDLLPMPHTLPLVFFAPDSLAGTMLRPLTEPETAPQVAVAAGGSNPGSEATAAQARPPVEALAQVDPEQMPDPEVEAPAEPEAEAPAAAQEELAAPPAGQEEPGVPPATTVHIIVENVESNHGTVNIAVCDTDFSPQGCPYKTSTPAARGFVEVVFDDVPPGKYAVVGYHDVNDNNEFDKFLSMPREPYALSGAAADELIPEFNDAMLKINQGENYVIIRMKRLGNG